MGLLLAGHVVRDILLTEIPHVLRSDLYAVAALAAASVVVIGDMLGLPYAVSAPVGGALCLGLRFMAIRHGWHLPRAGLPSRKRPDADEANEKKSR